MKLDTTANNSSFKLAFTGHTNIEKICNVEYIPEQYNKIAFGLIYKEINNKIINLLKQYSKDELVFCLLVVSSSFISFNIRSN